MRTVTSTSILIVLAILSLSAQTQFPDLAWERGGNTRPAYDIIPLSNNRLLVGSFDGSVRVWDLSSRSSTLTLITTRFLGGRAMALTPDEQFLITGDEDGWVRCWSMESGRLLFTLGRTIGRVNDVVCSPQGDWVAAGDSGGIVRRWSLNERTVLDTTLFLAPIRTLTVSPDGASMVVTTSLPEGTSTGIVATPARILDVPGLGVRAVVDGRPPGSGGSSPIYAAAYVNNSVIRMTTANAILTVDAATGQIVNRRDVDYFVPGGPEFLVVENQNSVITAGVLFAGLRRYLDGQATVDTIVEFGRQVASLAIDTATRRLFMATQASDVQVWSLDEDRFLFDLEGMAGYLRRAAWSIDGSFLATASTLSDRVRILRIDDGTAAHVISNPPWGFSGVSSMAFDVNGRSLYFTPLANDGLRRLRRYDVQSSAMDTSFARTATSVAVSRESGRVIALDRDSVFAFVSTDAQAQSSTAIDDCIPWTTVALRNGGILFSCADSTLRIIDGSTGAQRASRSTTSPIIDILVPASKPEQNDVLVLLAYGRTNAESIDALIVDAQTLQERLRLEALATPFIDGFLGNRIACSKSAAFFAVGRDDGTISIVDGSTKAVVKTLETGGSPVTYLTAHPDTEALVAGTADGRVVRLKNPWPDPVSSVETNDPLTADLLQQADDVRWYLLDGRCIGYGVAQRPLGLRQPCFVVARFGSRLVFRLLPEGSL